MTISPHSSPCSSDPGDPAPGASGGDAFVPRRLAGWLLPVAAAAALGVASCATPPPPVEPPPPAPAPPPEVVIRDKAVIESIRVLTLESFPVQAFVVVNGYLPDAATTIERTTQSRTGNAITVEILTVRPQSAVATTALVPFDRNIPLEIDGLPAGTYSVDVNGVTTTFALARDNIAP